MQLEDGRLPDGPRQAVVEEDQQARVCCCFECCSEYCCNASDLCNHSIQHSQCQCVYSRLYLIHSYMQMQLFFGTVEVICSS